MQKPNVVFRFECPYCRQPYGLSLDVLETDDARHHGAAFAEMVASHLERHLSRRCAGIVVEEPARPLSPLEIEHARMYEMSKLLLMTGDD